MASAIRLPALRQSRGLVCSIRGSAPQLIRVARTTARRAVPTQAHRGSSSSIDAGVEEPVHARQALEQLYLAANSDGLAPRPTAHSQHQPACEPQQHEHGTHVENECGRQSVGQCMEHTVDADGEVEAAAEPPAPSGPIGRLLDLLPISRRTRGILMLNVLVLLVATNWVVVKDVGASFDPFGFAFLRFAVAAAAFAPFTAVAARDKRVLRAGVEIGVWTAAGYITQSAGLLTTDASRASFLSTFTVLVVPFLAGLSGRGVSAVTWASCLAALVGVGLLEQGGAPPGAGDVWSFLSAVAFGVQVFRTEQHARTLGSGASLPLMSVVLTTTMTFSALAAGLAHPEAVVEAVRNPLGLQALFTADSFPWQQVLYTGLLTTDLALMMEVFALQDVSSVDAAIIYTLEPVLGAGLAWAMLGERLGAKGLAGAAIILASSLATQVLGGGGAEAAAAADAEE